MTYETFKEQIKGKILEVLPPEYQRAEVQIQKVVKNNEKARDSLTIMREGERICPSIYLESFYAELKQGKPMEAILGEIAEIQMVKVPDSIDIHRFASWEHTKDRIYPVLRNYEENKECLEGIPHGRLADLAVSYRVRVEIGEGQSGSVEVNNHMFQRYGISLDTLQEAAIENVNREPVMIQALDALVREIMGQSPWEPSSEPYLPERERAEEMSPLPSSGMYVVTNEMQSYGAGVIVSDRIKEQIAETLGGDYYIIPSSVHELLILPKDGEMDRCFLEDMVREVNQTMVSAEDKLSDHVYEYDSKEHTIYRCGQEMEKEAAPKEKTSLKEALNQKKEEAAKQVLMPDIKKKEMALG